MRARLPPGPRAAVAITGLAANLNTGLNLPALARDMVAGAALWRSRFSL